MLIDPDGLVFVCALCGALGFFLGWMGGVVEGREQERRRTRGVPGTEAPSSADAILRELVEAHAEWDAKHWSKRSDPGAADRLLKARRAARDYINASGVEGRKP